MYNNPTNEIQKLENEIADLTQKLSQLRKDNIPVEVKNYTFQTQTGKVNLLDLFGNKDQLLLIHNMGQGCRYCTLWADGFNAYVSHLESTFSIALVSKDDPDTQRLFANSRQWRFKMASHGGGEYIQEQSVVQGEKNVPGVVSYLKKDGKVFRKNFSVFGPGDQFCSLWHMISLLGGNAENWIPQFNYWSRPKTMDDGGENLKD